MAFQRFGTVFQLNVTENSKYVDYFKGCKYKLVLEDKEIETIQFNESIKLNDACEKATIFVANEVVFETKTEFELQHISIAPDAHQSAGSYLDFDEYNQRIICNERGIPSTRKDILESILNAKYQIKYTNPFDNNSDEQYGKVYQCALLESFAVPVEIPENIRKVYKLNLMVAPLVSKTVRRSAQGKWFNYESNLDANGIFYGFGTNFHATEYCNPVREGKLRIVSSTISGKETYCLVEREAVDLVVEGTGKDDQPFFYVHIGEHGLKPTAYTLRNSDTDNGFLTNWLLLASNDGVDWVTLNEHVNDDALKTQGPFEADMWDIRVDIDNNGSNAYFSYFKVLMSGTNHVGAWQFGCSGFELYGHLINGFECVYDTMTLLKSYSPSTLRINSTEPFQVDCKLSANKFDIKTGSG
eukprot:169013_1